VGILISHFVLLGEILVKHTLVFFSPGHDQSKGVFLGGIMRAASVVVICLALPVLLAWHYQCFSPASSAPAHAPPTSPLGPCSGRRVRSFLMGGRWAPWSACQLKKLTVTPGAQKAHMGEGEVDRHAEAEAERRAAQEKAEVTSTPAPLPRLVAAARLDGQARDLLGRCARQPSMLTRVMLDRLRRLRRPRRTPCAAVHHRPILRKPAVIHPERAERSDVFTRHAMVISAPDHLLL
jgi:hypothetical protein